MQRPGLIASAYRFAIAAEERERLACYLLEADIAYSHRASWIYVRPMVRSATVALTRRRAKQAGRDDEITETFMLTLMLDACHYLLSTGDFHVRRIRYLARLSLLGHDLLDLWREIFDRYSIGWPALDKADAADKVRKLVSLVDTSPEFNRDKPRHAHDSWWRSEKSQIVNFFD